MLREFVFMFSLDVLISPLCKNCRGIAALASRVKLLACLVSFTIFYGWWVACALCSFHATSVSCEFPV